MSAKSVRIAGIAALAMIPVALLFGVAYLGVAFSAAIGGSPASFRMGELIVVLAYVVFLAFATFVFWTTKGFFNAYGYRTADLPTVTLIVLLMVNLVPVLYQGWMSVLDDIVLSAAILLWMWFSIGAVGFGRHIGSRLWQATGIIYLIGAALIAAAIAVMASGDNLTPIMIVKYALPLMLAGWACHGIGLINGAKTMAQNRGGRRRSAPGRVR